MDDLVRYIAENLVEDPGAVHVDVRERGRMVELRLRVAREDMGRVIGKGGRIANAMRSLVRVAALKQGQRVNLEIR
ncbi:MAG: KH domain-containing protein [Ardenticatenaceae bacterium]|nr:KH domain-containing protein [Ardenticatenaceae bacterium]HBY92525.1 RNA-binding protein [Chloroflexota bacterium]